MDPEVHGFASEATSPINVKSRSDDPFIANGSDPSAWDSDLDTPADTYAQKQHKHNRKHKAKDIGERGYDEEVHGFVSSMVTPINVLKRSDEPYAYNGSDPSAHDANFAEKSHHKHHGHQKKPDIAERGMDPQVHGFASDNTPPLNG